MDKLPIESVHAGTFYWFVKALMFKNKGTMTEGKSYMVKDN